MSVAPLVKLERLSRVDQLLKVTTLGLSNQNLAKDWKSIRARLLAFWTKTIWWNRDQAWPTGTHALGAA
jgi:hypothetical protein